MITFALKLLLAHILGDFVLQPGSWIEKKRKRTYRSPVLYIHSGVHALLIFLLLQFELRYWPAVVTVLVSHCLIDLCKLALEDRMHNGWLFFLDQLAHLLVLFGVVYWYYPFPLLIPAFPLQQVLLLLIALFSISFASAIIMKVIMNQWQLPEDKAEDSLPRAGKYIGILERLFVFAFILLQQWSAIGWLVAAKSILRFSDLSRAKDRKLTEYVLIGTFLSFGLAITIGLLYQFLQGQL